ncbi:trypsin-like serine protease [Pseudaeromonas paramecii]|uniref:Peptidase S1 domain-containing protein n=1 Tax=Pseudaeromonas paramecii TaxID=2138166 RepID=A0ABP8QFX1_9GAMM
MRALASSLLLLCAPAALATDVVPTIVGGQTVSSAPAWMVSIQQLNTGYTNAHFCGGTLIAADWVVTAAHCVDDIQLDEIGLRIGDADLSTSFTPVTIDEVVVHPDWQVIYDGSSRTDFVGDMALLHLATSQSVSTPTLATLSQTQALEEVTDTSDTSNGDWLTAYGWGATDVYGNRYPDDLQTIDLPFEGMDTNYYPDHFYAGGVAGKSICFGDSGGPLLQDGILYGLTSFISYPSGSRAYCGNNGYTAGFTSIGYHLDWINDTIDGLNYTTNQALEVPYGETGTATFLIRNDDSQAWTLGQITSTATVSAACDQSTLAAGDTCEVNVSYTPSSATDDRTIEIDFTATAADSSTQSATLILHGTGITASSSNNSDDSSSDDSSDDSSDNSSSDDNSTSSDSGGGGSLPLGGLILLAAAGLRRRRQH